MSEPADLPQNVDEQNQQPNLVELCKGLPSGWQVCKQSVYAVCLIVEFCVVSELP